MSDAPSDVLSAALKRAVVDAPVLGTLSPNRAAETAEREALRAAPARQAGI